MISTPHTAVERLLWAYQFGHSWNRAPAYANLRNLDRGRVLLMDGSEADAKLLIASFQDFDTNVERLVAAFTGRLLEPDGEVGPATAAVMNMRRCAMPDFAPPPGAELSLDTWEDPELLGAIESYQEYAKYRNNDQEYSGAEGSWAPAEYVGGRGSWPKCDPQNPNVHSVRMNVILSGFSSQQKGQWQETAAAMARCSGRMGLSTRIVFDGNPEDAEHDVRGQNIPGNVIGFAYFPRPDTCDQTVVARIDNTFNVDLFRFEELNEHEEGGHSRGKEHRSRTSKKKSIMHPSIGNPDEEITWVDDAGEFEMVAWFGGQPIPTGPIDPEEPPPPPPPPPTGVLDTFTLAGVKYEIRKAGGPPPIEV